MGFATSSEAPEIEKLWMRQGIVLPPSSSILPGIKIVFLGEARRCIIGIQNEQFALSGKAEIPNFVVAQQVT